jgi:hypothetical protein
LPKVAPEYWGSDDNFLDVIGLFKDLGSESYPYDTSRFLLTALEPRIWPVVWIATETRYHYFAQQS